MSVTSFMILDQLNKPWEEIKLDSAQELLLMRNNHSNVKRLIEN